MGWRNRAGRKSVHFALGDEQILESDLSEDRIDRVLEHSPHRSDRAVGHVGAEPLDAGVRVAERGLVEPASERRENFTDVDLFGRAGQRVAAGLAARRSDEPALAEDPHHFRDVRLGDAFGAGKLGNGETARRAFATDAKETSETVLFLRWELHWSY